MRPQRKVDMVAASGQPKLWDLTPPDARKKVIELTRMVECKEAIGEIEDRTLPGPAGPLPFRIYTLFRLIIGLRLSIRSLPPLKMHAPQQHG
jgi:hypothetical protein